MNFMCTVVTYIIFASRKFIDVEDILSVNVMNGATLFRYLYALSEYKKLEKLVLLFFATLPLYHKAYEEASAAYYT